MTILVLRFSAIGDVAMTVPVVRALAMARPDLHIVMASRPFAKAFYEDLAENVSFVGYDLKQPRYKGTWGMEHLYQDLSSLRPDMVADLHDVLRTKYCRLRFRLRGVPVAAIDKHRAGRKALVRAEHKVMEQQPTSFEKYHQVFRALGLDFTLTAGAPLSLAESVENGTAPLLYGTHIGIAPFAAHAGKIYPTERMEVVIQLLQQAHPDLGIVLFGGGAKEKEQFEMWANTYDHVAYAGNICQGMRQELALMQQLRCMVSMDSGNMHMASLVGTPVVSVWGATHPLAGFVGWGQDPADCVQHDLPCRPCSIYGNRPCRRGDYACLNGIEPEEIVSRVEQYLK